MALADNIVSYWKLDESSGNATDSVGSNTGTNNSVTYTSAKINNGGEFNGSAYFNLGDNSTLRPTGSYTINLWFNADDVSSLRSLFTKDDWGPSGNRCYGLYINGTELYSEVFDTSGTGVYPRGSTISADTWYMATLRVDTSANEAELFLNADTVNTQSFTGSPSQDTIAAEIGRRMHGDRYFDGTIDEIGLWDRALSDSEITDLYNSGSGLQYPFTVASGPANLKTLNTVSTADIKTIDTTAIASVKTINTAS